MSSASNTRSSKKSSTKHSKKASQEHVEIDSSNEEHVSDQEEDEEEVKTSKKSSKKTSDTELETSDNNESASDVDHSFDELCAHPLDDFINNQINFADYTPNDLAELLIKLSKVTTKLLAINEKNIGKKKSRKSRKTSTAQVSSGIQAHTTVDNVLMKFMNKALKADNLSANKFKTKYDLTKVNETDKYKATDINSLVWGVMKENHTFKEKDEEPEEDAKNDFAMINNHYNKENTTAMSNLFNTDAVEGLDTSKQLRIGSLYTLLKCHYVSVMEANAAKASASN
jgi:hypothetical protein